MGKTTDKIGLSFETDDFIHDMKKLLKIVKGESLVKALSAGAMVIEGAAKQNAPFETGFLKASIQAQKPILFKKGGYVEVIVGAEYGIYQEYGTWKMTAWPYLRPATYENVEAVKNAIAAQLAISIKRSLQ